LIIYRAFGFYHRIKLERFETREPSSSAQRQPPIGPGAVIAYTQGVDGSIDSMIATQVTAASHPIERTIHVQTAACAAMRILGTPIQSCPIIPGING
jgi:hypothetical protein